MANILNNINKKNQEIQSVVDCVTIQNPLNPSN